MKKKKGLAQIFLGYYPVDVFVENPDKIKTMKQLRSAIVCQDTGDGLFDFIVEEIGQERNKNEILFLLNKAIGDIQRVIHGVLREY